MRVMLAYDASEYAEQAVSLVKSMDWPERSEIEIVSVFEPLVMRTPMAPPQVLNDTRIDDMIAEHLKEQADLAVQTLRDAGIAARATSQRGRPATVLVDATRASRPDLLIVGSRGRGGIASLILGSVSAEVVDNAACPVLVARNSNFGRVLLATDGSETAALATQLVANWPIFERATIRVVSVADVPGPWTTEVAPEFAVAFDDYARELADAQAQHDLMASQAAERLQAAGRNVDHSSRVGDAASEIIEEARSWPADVIVLGSRGQTGLTRLLLGSVARNVLLGSEASVLIVRQTEPPGSD